MKRKNRQFAGLFVIVAIILLLTVYIKFFNGSIIYISTGLKDNVLFKVSGTKAYTWEADILLADAKSEYESVFGSNVWSQTMEGVSVEDYVKDQVQSKLIRVKCMNLLAKEKGVVLSRAQKEQVSSAAEEYYNGLSAEQTEQLGVTKEQLEDMFTEFAIADTLYEDITSQANIEVSSDDARVIMIQYICCDNESDILTAKERLDSGESFYTVAKDYGGEEESESELKRGQMEASFETAAFDLKTGETSAVVEAAGRYYIIKCTSDNEKSKTEANKLELIDDKKLEYFNNTFEEYEASKYIEYNKKAWNGLKASDAFDLQVSFEDIFNKYVK